MIELMEKPYKDSEIKKILNHVVVRWFEEKFGKFSEPQRYAIPVISNKENILVSAVTGSGKTLCAFASILSGLISLSEQDKLEDKIYCVYISPLKSLSNDLEINLKQPLKEMENLAKRKFKINVKVRTGDSTQSQKASMARKAPHILLTTPESLAIVLSSPKFREKLRDVKCVILDEIHALAENKRGVHLSLSLERLERLANNNFSRIGLSATISPLDQVARFLVGVDRKCKIADVDLSKKMDIKVLSPVNDLINTSHNEMHSSMYKLLDNLIQEHRTSLIFTNTRSATERVVHHLKEKFPKNYTENIGAHHGSLSKEHRLNLEKRMREGKLKVIACSTSLELGIDIGYVDLVILLGSPKSIARCIQRIGRAGHNLHDTIKGRIIVLDRDDLVECGVMLKNVLERKIDKIHIPKNCLDVLAQQIFGVAVADRINIEEIYNLVKRSYCYSDLEREKFDEVIDYLRGEFSSLEDRHVYAKIWLDEKTGEIGKKGKLARVLYMTNIGTIPDETSIKVKIGDNVIGGIDESFLERLRKGDVFVLGGNTYEFKFARGMTAQVSASVDRPPTVPSWFSEMLPLSFDLALEILKFRGLVENKFQSNKNKKEILDFIDSYLYVDKNAINAIYNYFREQYLYLNEISNDKKLVVEHYSSEDKKYVVFHSLYGRRVNDCLSRTLGYAVGKLYKRDVEIGVNDNGFYLASNKNIQVMNAFKLLKSKELGKVLRIAINDSEVLRRRFRHCACRALMILRSYKGRRKKVGRQQVSSMLLINAVRRIKTDFCILEEAKREVLEDLMDVENSIRVLEEIEKEKIKIKEVYSSLPSPFAFNLVLQGYTDMFKIEDKVEFLRNMHQMILAKIGKKYKL